MITNRGWPDAGPRHPASPGVHERRCNVSKMCRSVADRREGAVRALERAGLSPDDLHMIVTPALNVAAGQRAGATLAELSAAQRPTAVFCANDLLALGVLQEMTAQRIRVPEDISLIGYDDIDFAAAAAVPLSS